MLMLSEHEELLEQEFLQAAVALLSIEQVCYQDSRS